MSIQVYQTSRNRSIYVFGWCLWQEYLSFYILTPTKLLYKLQRMSWIYGGFDIVTIIFCHALCMLYHVWLCSCHPCDLSLIFFSLLLPIQFENNIRQVINYNFIKTIKGEPTFGKYSICDQSSLSYKKEHLTRYQL